LKAARETSEEAEIIKQELAEAQQKYEQELAQQKQTFLNTEADYLTRIEAQDQELKAKIKEFQTSNGELLKRIEELKTFRETAELPEDYEDLITERDEAIREKRTLEQDLLASNNRLNLKQQEVTNKEKALEKLKREKNQLEVQQQKALKEKNGLITTLQGDINKLKDKYSKQGKLLDTEQLECKKLEEENEKLKAEIKQLKGGSH
jgi:chromosome segregation ATPase